MHLADDTNSELHSFIKRALLCWFVCERTDTLWRTLRKKLELLGNPVNRHHPYLRKLWKCLQAQRAFN
eukprot:3588587-Amphidinium_carterae.1